MPSVNIQGIGKVNFPDDYTPDRIKFAIENDILPRVKGRLADQVPGAVSTDVSRETPEGGRGFLETVRGGIDAAGTGLANLAGGAVGLAGGTLGAIAGSIRMGDAGTPEGNRLAQDVALTAAGKLTRAPGTEAGKDITEAAGDVFHASKLAGLNPAAAVELSFARPAVALRQGATAARDAVSGALKREPAEMGGASAGAAETAADTIRRQRAASMTVPIKLTKGEATRDFEQQRFEKETMKDSPYGEPLRQRAADNVGAVIKNFESWVDETGAEAPNLIGTGKAVDRALVKKMESAKAEIRNAYVKAEKSGEMAQPVDVAPLVGFVEENRSAAKLAPVIKAVEDELVRLGGATRDKDGVLVAGQMPLNDVEKMRKLIVRLSRADDTNGHYGGEANKVIDAMTEGAGGDLYKQARGMFKDYAQEFKGQGAVRKLVTTKPGGTDRAVALEDVFNHSVLSGSNQDTANIIKSLEGAGPEGLQAIRELKGATMNYLLDETTKNAGRDIRGQPIPSFDKINKAVRSLDADGKLDLIFGKTGAQQIRDMKDLIADIHTAPPGAVNTSTTAAVLREGLLALATGRIPTALAKTISGIKQAVGDRATMRRVREALGESEADQMAGNRTVH